MASTLLENGAFSNCQEGSRHKRVPQGSLQHHAEAPSLFGSPAPCAPHVALNIILVFKPVTPLVIFLVLLVFFHFWGFFVSSTVGLH